MRLRRVRRGLYDGVHKLATVGDAVEGVYDTLNDPLEYHDMAADNPKLTGLLRRKLTEFTQSEDDSGPDSPGSSKVDDSIVENLRALGYIE